MRRYLVIIQHGDSISAVFENEAPTTGDGVTVLNESNEQMLDPSHIVHLANELIDYANHEVDDPEKKYLVTRDG